MSKILCFGELLLRYCPDPEGEWTTQNTMPVYIGGAELNVANALGKWKQQVAYCTAIPDNYMSKSIIKSLKDNGIDTNSIILNGNRIGAYYLPLGSELKNAGVIYDRANSSYAQLKIGDIDWDKVFENITWFHLSAICPALNQNIADLCVEGLKIAKQKGITTSIDLNYRKALWQYGANPVEIMKKLMPYCDHIMGNIWSINSLCGIENPLKNPENPDNTALKPAGETISTNLRKVYSNIQSIALTFRMTDHYWALFYHNNQFYQSKKFTNLVLNDRVGSGDCFMAGIIYGLSNKYSEQQIINFAAAAAVGKLAEKGDATHQNIEQINQRINEQT